MNPGKPMGGLPTSSLLPGSQGLKSQLLSPHDRRFYLGLVFRAPVTLPIVHNLLHECAFFWGKGP